MAKNQNTFIIRTSASGITVNSVDTTNQNQTQFNSLPFNVKCEKNTANIEFDGFDAFSKFYESFSTDILLMHTTEKNLNTIFNAFEKLVVNYERLIMDIMPDYLKKQLSAVVPTATNFVVEKLRSLNSNKKRQKLVEKSESCVPAIDCGMALTWTSKNVCGSDLVDHRLVQTTYQYVSIIDTIKSLFINSTFRKSYFDFNERFKHVCSDDKYENFCCGSIYKKHEVFTPATIQLQLGMDEFEPCNALKTKAGLHKMYAVYLQINNMDPKLKSKLGNIHLVALAKSCDVKAGDADKIANKIVSDLKVLETEGITIEPGLNLKAVLITVCSDNLGANAAFGFVESFNSTYFCRICELTSAECKITTTEIAAKIRRKQSYEAVLQSLDEIENLDYKETKGIKKSCVFNKLRFFHILDNCTIDIMHDINEGVIPFFMDFFFKHMITKKIATFSQIQALCRDHNYGYLWNKYKPSVVKLEKTRLNQNAMQSYCLIQNLPFILIGYKEQLEPEWQAMTDVLQILQILFSSRVRKTDVYRLRNLIKNI